MIKRKNISAYSVAQIVSYACMLESRDDKVSFLAQFKSKGLENLVKYLYMTEWDGLEIPVYTKNTRDHAICYASFHNIDARLSAILKLKDSNPKRAELLLIRVLEELSSEDAALLATVIQGKKIKGISKSVFKEVYPTLFRFQNDDDNQGEED